MQQLLLGLFALALPLLAFGQMNNITRDGYTIEYPAEANKLRPRGTEWAIMDKLRGPQDGFSENVNLTLEQLPKYISLEEHTEKSALGLSSVIADFKEISGSYLGQGPNRFYRHIYTGRLNGMKLYWIQETRVWEDRAYILTFTTTNPAQEENLAWGKAIMASFRLEEVQGPLKTWKTRAYEIQYGRELEQQRSLEDRELLRIFKPQDPKISGRPNLSLKSSHAFEEDELDATVQKAVQAFPSAIEDFQLISAEPYSRQGQKGWRLLFTGKQGDKTMQSSQEIYLHNKRIVYFTLTTEKEHWEKDWAWAEEILNTVVWK